MRTTFYKGPTEHEIVTRDGLIQSEVREDLVRAQYPHLVTLCVYSSLFDIEPKYREYFVYAPMDYKNSVRIACELWKRWEKPWRKKDDVVEDLRLDFPKVDDAAVSDPIDDKFFDEMWRDVRGRKHHCAGSPLDPFAFTCLDYDVRVHKTSSFQAGLRVTA